MNNKSYQRYFLFFSMCILLHNTFYGQEKLYPNEFPLRDVTLIDGPFLHARDLNIQTLLKYDVDRLLAPYLKESGLPEKAKSFTNWEGLDGHIAGHYLSALAMNFASTGNIECWNRMEYMISELKKCQEANSQKYPDWGIGYLGGIPNSKDLWPKIKAGDVGSIWKYWVPWYNVHKIYAGLRDVWLYTGIEDAKNIFLKFCDWAIQITSELTDAQMEEMLGNEHGGMNEIFADAYQITGNQKYLTTAKRFSHKILLNAMAAGNDNLDNKHANTQVPKVVGFQRIAELTGNKDYTKASRFFWETVTSNRTLAFGGNSRREFFPSAAACEDFVNDVEGPESCNTYNMLKLTEDLFRTNPLAKYTDFYERAMYNHILSTQHPDHGGYVYFTPARPRHYRVYSAPNQAMWCCVGSGMENHGKYNQLIYTRRNDSLYVNLFIASELNWKEKGIKIRQETKFPDEEQTVLKIIEGSSHFKLLIRYPSWVKDKTLTISVNGKNLLFKSHPSSYIAMDRLWKAGDEVQIVLPMHNSVEKLPNVPGYVAFLHGPILLGAKTEDENLKGLVADDNRWGHIPSGERLPIVKAPIIIDDNITDIANKLEPIKEKPLYFRFAKTKLLNYKDVILQPFYQIHDSRYMIYWMALTNKGYNAYLDSVASVENAKMELQKQTIDFVAPGEQQPEADHYIEKENSNSGNFLDEFWRDAGNGGYFSYNLTTNSETNLSLVVRYWGAEWGSRKFDIFIDNAKLITVDNTGKWNISKFRDIEYQIPDSLIKGKTQIRVKFQSLPGSTTGAVYYVRLIKNN